MKEKILVVRIFFMSIFLIVLISWAYLSFFSTNLQLSPAIEGLSYESALSLLNQLGADGIEWYCGEKESFTDSQGNVYGKVELDELKKILGNNEELNRQLCG